MRVRIYPATLASVEIDGVIFHTPQAIDRFIKALEMAKKAVWSEPKK